MAKRANVTITYPYTGDPRAIMDKARECCRELGISIWGLRATRSASVTSSEMACKIEYTDGANAELEEGVLEDYLLDSPKSV
jgi:1,2-phenylacetyl-CoA epoxidase PaaB subunit